VECLAPVAECTKTGQPHNRYVHVVFTLPAPLVPVSTRSSSRSGSENTRFWADGRQLFFYLITEWPVNWRLLYCQREQGSVIQKLRAEELRNLRQQLLIHPRGGICRIRFGECRNFLHAESLTIRSFGFGNSVSK